MPGPLLLAIDEGTTSATVLALDARRRVVGRASRAVPLVTPRPGWVEQDPAAIWSAVRWAAGHALRQARAERGDVKVIGIANQRETTILWDRRTGQPVAPAIVWQDRRTADRCDALRPTWESTVRNRTGLLLDPYFSATKLEALLAARRGRTDALAFGTVDSWLAYKFTGRHVTDPTNASRTLLWDIHKGAWDPELLELFHVPEGVLPEVVPSASLLGPTTWAPQAQVAALVGDQQAALVGQGCVRAGQAKNTYGTGCFLLQHTGSTPVRSRRGLLTTRAATTGAAQFALEGAVFTAGALVEWLRTGLGVIRNPEGLDRLAGAVPDSGGVHVVPAFTGLGAPHWDARARGALLGLTRGTDRRHIARAAIEGIAFQCADLVDAMQRDSRHPIPRLRVDGGVAKSGLLLQVQADLLGKPVVRPANVESTALGAAALAGHAADWWALVAPPAAGDRTFRPAKGRPAASQRMKDWHRAVAATRLFGGA
ncbi:MAG: FGGY family carbohydrate kinase [Thermoplasmatota archaeon]